MRDILGNSEFGLIVPIDAHALAEGMERLLTDDTLRAHYEEMAAERALTYEPEHCVEKIEELFA
jgi:glycosyltransferase involved in cell wall biosynthesis